MAKKPTMWKRPELWTEKWGDWPCIDARQLGPRRYMLLSDFRWQGVVVPRGFITDAASIPRFAWSWTRPEGIWPAALIHDWRFNQCGERGALGIKAANIELYDNVQALGYRKSKAWIVWAGPALWGQRIWNGYLKIKASARIAVKKQRKD